MIYEVEISKTKIYSVKVVMDDAVIHKDKIVNRAYEILESNKDKYFIDSNNVAHIIQNVS